MEAKLVRKETYNESNCNKVITRFKIRALAPPTDSTFVCGFCRRIYRSRIGLQSYLREMYKFQHTLKLWTRLSDNVTDLNI